MYHILLLEGRKAREKLFSSILLLVLAYFQETLVPKINPLFFFFLDSLFSLYDLFSYPWIYISSTCQWLLNMYLRSGCMCRTSNYCIHLSTHYLYLHNQHALWFGSFKNKIPNLYHTSAQIAPPTELPIVIIKFSWVNLTGPRNAQLADRTWFLNMSVKVFLKEIWISRLSKDLPSQCDQASSNP